MNFNTMTDVNESRFADIAQYQEITSPDTIYELLGDVIILNRHQQKEQYDELYERVVDVCVCCWNIHVKPDNKDSDVLQHTLIKFKVDIDDTQTYAIPLNRFMISMAFIRAILPYIDRVDLNDFILHKFMAEKDRVEIQNRIVKLLMGMGHTVQEVQEIMARMSLDLKEQTLVFGHADMQICFWIIIWNLRLFVRLITRNIHPICKLLIS